MRGISVHSAVRLTTSKAPVNCPPGAMTTLSNRRRFMARETLGPTNKERKQRNVENAYLGGCR